MMKQSLREIKRKRNKKPVMQKEKKWQPRKKKKGRLQWLQNLLKKELRVDSKRFKIS